MATETELRDFHLALDGYLSFDLENLYSRPEWGSITFFALQESLERVNEVVSSFKVLQIGFLPDNTLSKITSPLLELNEQLRAIDRFNVDGNKASPKLEAANIIELVMLFSREVFESSFQYIPFLAYRAGNIESKITSMVSNIENILVDAKEKYREIETKNIEINNLITTARETAVTTGIGTFTKEFLNESITHENSARFWLKITTFLGIITLVASIFLGSLPFWIVYDANRIIQLVAAKITILLILLTATLWTGKLYKISLHLSVVNKHKANALKTFLAFSKAASDEQTKNVVLTEAAHCIFSTTNTGLADSNDASEQIKVLEVFKGIGSKN